MSVARALVELTVSRSHRARRFAPEYRPNPISVPDDRLNRLINLAVSEIEQLLRAQINHFSKHCESPIEELFAAASLLHREGARHLGVEMYHFGSPFNREKRGCDWDSTDVYLQAQIGQYRADFLFDDLHEGKRRFIVVELDGHDWHERTKQQATRDKKRDRALVAAGYRIMRFTGSEIYADPGECLQEVIDAILTARSDG
jgi:very-short-patch-repair endonuclease